jgi:protein SCO1/2
MRAAVPALAFIAAAALQFAPAIAVPAVPHLIDQTGHTFTLESLRGRPLVVTFISAHCTDACPLINAQFSDAATQIARRHLSTRLLTITLDPAHDPPSLMRTLATRFDANPHYWLLASGPPKDVDAILNDYGVIARPGKSGYREAHTTFVYVFEADGKLEKTLLASTNLADDIVAEARVLNSRTGR